MFQIYSILNIQVLKSGFNPLRAMFTHMRAKKWDMVQHNGEKQAKMVKNKQNDPKILTPTCHPI